MFTKTTKVILIALAFFILSVSRADAATFNIVTDRPSVSIGDKFGADIKIDSAGAPINAAQATLKFSPSVLEITSVDKSGSIFNFWLDEPTFSNQTGELNFTAGAPADFSGKSLQILRINFSVKGTGKTEISFIDGAITASDGSGTNVLSAMEGIEVQNVPTSATKPVPGAPSVPVTPEKEETPVQIVRPPVTAERLPAIPKVDVLLYPDPEKWYNYSSKFSVKWTLPRDISDVATAINKNPSFNPAVSEGLFDNKTFARLEEGIWYLHVRFRNSVGWGPTAHYRLALDTSPPLPFEIKSKEGLSTDVPNPTIIYATGDELSGLDHYTVRVDSGEVVVASESYELPLQKPGKHSIRVTAEDRAQNAVGGVIEIEILPLEEPTISSFTKDVFVGEGNLAVNGLTVPGFSVVVEVKDSLDAVAYSTTVESDRNGIWAVRMEQPLKKGVYYIEATAQDARGALSLPVKSDNLRVREKPLLILAGVEITQFGFFVGLLSVLLLGVALGVFINKRTKEQRGRKILIAKRDVNTAFQIIKKDVDSAMRLTKDQEGFSSANLAELNHFMKRIDENLEKMNKYLTESIEEIN